MKFTEFGLDSRILEAIEIMGYKEPSPVQEKAIPAIMDGKDIIASAQTGTGKTAAFLLPVIHRLINSKKKGRTIKALVIVPTRELALQIDQQMDGFSYYTPISSIAVYGGSDANTFIKEKQALIEGADVVICTPGKMIAHLNQEYVNIQDLEYLVLDEADRMLDMGFFEDIVKIVSFLPKTRSNLMFAATMPDKIRQLARKVLVNPLEVNIAVSKPAENILQQAYIVYEEQKLGLIKTILQGKKLNSIIVFCSTKKNTKQVAKMLVKHKFNAEEIHSDLDQKEREEVLLGFRNKKINILVATDIISRGIDIEDIDLIINYDVPNEGEDYIHRIGRTARAASEGVAITFVNKDEQYKFQRIEKLLGSEIRKEALPEGLGEAPSYNPGGDKKRFGKKKYPNKNFKKKRKPQNKGNNPKRSPEK